MTLPFCRQPQSIGLGLCWSSMWEEGYCSPLHTALELGLLSGEDGAFEPTQAWQEFRDENSNETASAASFASEYTKPFVVEMKCSSPPLPRFLRKPSALVAVASVMSFNFIKCKIHVLISQLQRLNASILIYTHICSVSWSLLILHILAL